ncbi:folate-binding protein YgfZ [Paracoccus sp. R12_1]|uniref:CAF17-like 4Fe-4S cluster assembly/insertion protein YgfZ n=1 Tax=unclassified Paracoccus (in: a-proteobacteria) TaxID=2688777 RepID=UPI001ADA40E8|nr:MULTISPECIES: folate-binding protein YgfZ [unclassified Paracoccus (in: a-proteobacteria)]MBO9456369.1 folate-binding protein YgfZ [Paracoccus sp. R12_2]MBO9487578.1 folate-binding protein YgfZ [Paracoccus sp. R12_1]
MNRKIIRVTGEDRVEFLQGLVTNDVTRAPCWAAMLTPQGKYLADFLIVPGDDALLLDVDAGLADDLIRRLSMYKLRSRVELQPTDMTVARGTGPVPDGAIADPRHDALGWRDYGQTGDDGSDWDAIRVEHCIPETLIELIPNETFILEVGFERLHGVDFRKGCYVGQEVTARMKHKAELRKGLTTLRVEGEAPVGTQITRDGRAVGTLFTQSGGRGLAHVRFDRLGDGMEAGPARIFAA